MCINYLNDTSKILAVKASNLKLFLKMCINYLNDTSKIFAVKASNLHRIK